MRPFCQRRFAVLSQHPGHVGRTAGARHAVDWRHRSQALFRIVFATSPDVALLVLSPYHYGAFPTGLLFFLALGGRSGRVRCRICEPCRTVSATAYLLPVHMANASARRDLSVLQRGHRHLWTGWGHAHRATGSTLFDAHRTGMPLDELGTCDGTRAIS